MATKKKAAPAPIHPKDMPMKGMPMKKKDMMKPKDMPMKMPKKK